MPPSTRLTVPQGLPGVELTQAEKYLKVLTFGHSGSGKTRLVATAAEDPRTSPTLILDPSGGTTGVLEYLQAHGAAVRSVGDTDSILEYTTWLIANQGGGFKCLVVDDFSEAFSLTKERVAKRFGHASAAELDPREHATLYEYTLKVYRALRKVASPVEAGGAGVHVLVNCWTELKPNREQQEYWVPRFAGQFGYATPAYFDIVGFLESTVKREKSPGQEAKHSFTNRLVTASNTYYVKDRWDLLGGELRSPTVSKLLDALAGNPVSEITS